MTKSTLQGFTLLSNTRQRRSQGRDVEYYVMKNEDSKPQPQFDGTLLELCMDYRRSKEAKECVHSIVKDGIGFCDVPSCSRERCG